MNLPDTFSYSMPSCIFSIEQRVKHERQSEAFVEMGAPELAGCGCWGCKPEFYPPDELKRLKREARRVERLYTRRIEKAGWFEVYEPRPCCPHMGRPYLEMGWACEACASLFDEIDRVASGGEYTHPELEGVLGPGSPIRHYFRSHYKGPWRETREGHLPCPLGDELVPHLVLLDEHGERAPDAPTSYSDFNVRDSIRDAAQGLT